jgi:hypothetical protein
MVNLSSEEAQKLYKKGFIDGLECFAYWKDGIGYVGTSGETLKDAIDEVETLWNYDQNRPWANL